MYSHTRTCAYEYMRSYMQMTNWHGWCIVTNTYIWMSHELMYVWVRDDTSDHTCRWRIDMADVSSRTHTYEWVTNSYMYEFVTIHQIVHADDELTWLMYHHELIHMHESRTHVCMSSWRYIRSYVQMTNWHGVFTCLTRVFIWVWPDVFTRRIHMWDEWIRPPHVFAHMSVAWCIHTHAHMYMRIFTRLTCEWGGFG